MKKDLNFHERIQVFILYLTYVFVIKRTFFLFDLILVTRYTRLNKMKIANPNPIGQKSPKNENINTTSAGSSLKNR